jgi:hypothetical protein
MMADDTRKLSITYLSGLIPPPEYMSTLAVFYGKIRLFYPMVHTCYAFKPSP